MECYKLVHVGKQIPEKEFLIEEVRGNIECGVYQVAEYSSKHIDDMTESERKELRKRFDDSWENGRKERQKSEESRG